MNTVFVDVDTQLDFLFPSGALYVPGAERIVPAVAHLNHFAAARGIPVISTTDAHAEDDPEFKSWPAHCVSGANGQHKAERTLLDNRIVVPNRDCELSLDDAKQIIVEKQTVDVFQARNLPRVIDALAADNFVVYGVVTEICVRYAAEGLLQCGKRVTIATDAIESLKPEDSTRTLATLRAAGAHLATVAEISHP